MRGASSGAWAGLAFLCGFALALRGAVAMTGSLEGPRATAMHELNGWRSAVHAPPLQPDRHLGQLANRHARALATGSALARASGAADLERAARGEGWRGTGPLTELRLDGDEPLAALRARIAAGGAEVALLEAARGRFGLGLASAGSRGRILVVLLAGPEPTGAAGATF